MMTMQFQEFIIPLERKKILLKNLETDDNSFFFFRERIIRATFIRE